MTNNLSSSAVLNLFEATTSINDTMIFSVPFVMIATIAILKRIGDFQFENHWSSQLSILEAIHRPDRRLPEQKSREKPRTLVPGIVFGLRRTSPSDRTVGPLCFRPVSPAHRTDYP